MFLLVGEKNPSLRSKSTTKAAKQLQKAVNTDIQTMFKTMAAWYAVRPSCEMTCSIADNPRRHRPSSYLLMIQFVFFVAL